MFVENLPAFFLDFGVTVAAGSLSTQAIFDAPDDSVLGERVTSMQYSITYVSGSLGTLTYLSSVTVSGTPSGQFDGPYRVRVVNSIEDGRMQRAILEVQAT